jgi:hypothetical protein
MENKNAELIRKMMSLVETVESELINTKILSESQVDENETEELNEDLIGGYVKDVIGASNQAKRASVLAKLSSEFEGPLKMMLKDAEYTALLKRANIRTSEELVNAIAKGLSSDLKGSLELSILKSQGSSARLVDAAAENLTRNKQFLAKYKNEINAGQPAFEKALMDSKKYSNQSITKIVEKVNGKYGMKVTDDMIKGVKTKTPTKPTDTKIKPKTDAEKIKIGGGKKWKFGGGDKYHEWLRKIWEQGKNKWKFIGETNGVKKYMVPKSIIKWALFAGGAYLLYSFLTNSDGSDVEIVDEGGKRVDPLLTDSMVGCMKDLVNKGATLTKSNDGSPVVVVKQTGNPEYDKLGGLAFFMNGRVWSADFKTKRGSWKCSGGKIQSIPENFINEASSSISKDVETMIDLLDFPVTGSNLSSAKNLLQKYVSNGQGKEFLNLYQKSGLGGGSLKKSLDYIVTINAGSVESKEKMYQMISQINSGKGGVPVKTGGETVGLDGVEITWDGEGKPNPNPDPNPDPNPTPKKSKYFDCPDFPMIMGCKSPRIKELQYCLGMESKYQTGNFGPKTYDAIAARFREASKNEVGVSGAGAVALLKIQKEGLTSDMFNNMIKNCKGRKEDTKPVTTTTGSTTGSTTTTTTTPEKPKTDTVPTASATTNGGMTPDELYRKLVKDKTLFGRLRGRRIVYKGPDLSKDDYEKLVQYMSSTGYRLSRFNNDYNKGDKLVFKRNKAGEPETANIPPAEPKI